MKNTRSKTRKQKTNDVSLTVLDEQALVKRAKPHSRMGKRRAVVLIVVHLLIIAHILLWVRTGSTVSPVEPSEAMLTLETGVVNAGFIFFVLAIGATIVFGRFFCGWGCHVVALQDLCTWMMNKCGVRPKPFRSRLLVWAPLAFGFYMFMWPTLKRLAIFPLLQTVGIDPPLWLGAVAEFHGFSSGIIVEDFWATFPPWYVAVPFLGVVGFASVYFLGSKGFCTYGCPYGGIFGVADRFSPGRIVVNDDCHQCGHCTAVCTSNVRVNEEVRDFGMVVNPGCMKCLDCVSACPNDALSFSFAKPSNFKQPVDDSARRRQAKNAKNPKRYDLNWPEEIVLTVVFIAMFFAVRGMLNLVPMLMAAGMAGIGTFAAWKLWALIAKPNVRIQSLVLKAKGKIKMLGFLSGAITLGIVLSSVWSGFVNHARWLAKNAHDQIDVPIAMVIRPEYVPTARTRELADAGSRAFGRSAPFFSGGLGWALNAEHKRKYAYFLLIGGDAANAELLLHDIVDEGTPTAQLVQQLAVLMRSRGASPSHVLDVLMQASESHEAMAELAPTIAIQITMINEGQFQAAFEFWDSQIESNAQDPVTRYQAAEFAIAAAQPELARQYLDSAAELQNDDARSLTIKSRVLAKLGDRDAAIDTLGVAADLAGDNPFELATIVSMLTALDRYEQAEEVAKSALTAFPASLSLLQADVALAIMQRDIVRAKTRSRALVSVAESDPWQLLSVGESIVRNGLRARNRELAQIGIESIREALVLKPGSSLILHDLGQALMATGNGEDGLAMLEQAAALEDSNQALANAVAVARVRLGIDTRGSP